MDARFPLRVSARYAQGDRPIAFLHWHDCLELGWCEQGSGIFVVGGKVLSYRAGHGVFIGPSEPHLAQSTPGTRSLWRWIWLDPVRLLGVDAAEWTDLGALCGPGFANLLDPELAVLVARIGQEADRRRTGWREVCRSLLRIVLIELHRRTPAATSAPRDGAALTRLAPALHLLTRDHDQPLRIATLARRCGLSEAQFRRVFHQAFGHSPHAHLTMIRLRMAATLLSQPGRSVLEVSEAAGFPTLTSFHRAWRRWQGVPPGVWRRANRATD